VQELLNNVGLILVSIVDAQNHICETLRNSDNDTDGYTMNEGDCDDTDDSIYPGAEEVCGDGIDQDCDGEDLENNLSGYIVFDGFQDGDCEIYRMRADGTEVVQLTNNDSFDAFPRVSPDGTEIIYSHGSTDQEEIWIMNRDGNNAYYLFNGKYPNFSPDGKKIVYSGYGGNIWDAYDLFLYDRESNEHTELTNFVGFEISPAWSPDGSQIAYVNKFNLYGSNYKNIEIINIDGTGRINLTNYGDFDWGSYATRPRWSPGGGYIFYWDSIMEGY